MGRHGRSLCPGLLWGLSEELDLRFSLTMGGVGAGCVVQAGLRAVLWKGVPASGCQGAWPMVGVSSQYEGLASRKEGIQLRPFRGEGKAWGVGIPPECVAGLAGQHEGQTTGAGVIKMVGGGAPTESLSRRVPHVPKSGKGAKPGAWRSRQTQDPWDENPKTPPRLLHPPSAQLPAQQ